MQKENSWAKKGYYFRPGGGMNGVLCDVSHASFTDGVWSKTDASNYSEACVFNLWRASLLNWGVRIR